VEARADQASTRFLVTEAMTEEIQRSVKNAEEIKDLKRGQIDLARAARRAGD
jgi:hypothetical protein